VKEKTVNVFAPGHPHPTQKEVLKVLDAGQRYVMLRAGRKWRKTSLIISWLAEQALITKLTCPYIAPNRTQAKNIVWNDHIVRLLDEFKRKKISYKTNETELSVQMIGGGKLQLHGVENKDALRGISNWGAVGMDEYDDWEEDIYPTIIRPNLIPHKAPCVIAGTPKGYRNLYRIEQGKSFKCFHFTSYDNQELDPEEMASIEQEYKDMGMGYYRQEILAEYEKPHGVVYEEWDVNNFIDIDYDPNLPLYITFDFGVNDPTAIIWLQRMGGEFRIVDYYESNNADIGHYVSVIKAKPYKTPELVTGDPAGKARSIVTNTSPIEEYAKKGIHIRIREGVDIPTQIRITHKYMKGLYISNKLGNFKELILNYRYPTKKESAMNQSNEIPIHDRFSHGMRALEYFFVNIDSLGTYPNTTSKNLPKFEPYDKVIGI